MDEQHTHEQNSTKGKTNEGKQEWHPPKMVELALGATKNNRGGGPDGFKVGTNHS